MIDHDWLAQQFEENRTHLRGVAYRMLGSLHEADDAVQECWLRLSRSETESVENLRAWLTTVVARICLDMLRSRKSRREEPLETPETPGSKASAIPHHAPDPETEAIMADSVGLATLVVLDRLNPAERLAFVLHDLFDIPFDDIARIVGRTSDSVRQLASRARRRVRGATELSPEIAQQRSLVNEFLTALRAGDVPRLLAILTPEFAAGADLVAAPRGVPADTHGAEAWAKQAIQSARGARFARPALIDGVVGLVVAPRGRLVRALRFTFAGSRIAHVDVIGDPAVLNALDLAALDD